VSDSIQLAPDVLYKLYVDDKLSKSEIAHKLGISYMQARYSLAKFNIPMRNHRQAGAISASRYLKRSQPVICPVCGKEFELAAYRVKRAKVACCSWKCGRILRLQQFRKAHEGYLAKHPRIEKVCPICGQCFTVKFSSRNRRKYCSDRCKGIACMLSLAKRSKPTKPEQTIIDMTNKYFPQFKYNGGGNLGVTLAGMIPDFVNINGKKQVIEVFGDYYHTVLATNWKKTELGRKMAYNSIGYDCLVFWEGEIKAKSETELVEIIRGFASKRHKKREVLYGFV